MCWEIKFNLSINTVIVYLNIIVLQPAANEGMVKMNDHCVYVARKVYNRFKLTAKCFPGISRIVLSQNRCEGDLFQICYSDKIHSNIYKVLLHENDPTLWDAAWQHFRTE